MAQHQLCLRSRPFRHSKRTPFHAPLDADRLDARLRDELRRTRYDGGVALEALAALASRQATCHFCTLPCCVHTSIRAVGLNPRIHAVNSL